MGVRLICLLRLHSEADIMCCGLAAERILPGRLMTVVTNTVDILS
jgi:hypothetical protein